MTEETMKSAVENAKRFLRMADAVTKRHKEALDPDNCPSGAGHLCRCQKCSICGFRAHTAIHCGVMGALDKPYGHIFIPVHRIIS